MTIYVLGAGPAGLAVADGLASSPGDDFVLLERTQALGGLAQTVHWDGVGHHDLGPHKIFTTDAELMRRVESLLPAQQWLTREKISSIYMNGHYLPYPPSPFSLARVFGLPAFVKMVLGYGTARVRVLLGNKRPATFEQDLTQRLGPALYDVLFKPIALKLWGDPRRLDVKLSQGRVQTPKLSEVLGRLLGIRRKSEFEALDFRYPVGGLGQLWNAIFERTRERGRYLLGHAVSGFDIADNRVHRIRCQRASDGAEVEFDVGEGDFVVSTMPLAPTARLLAGRIVPAALSRIDEVVALNDLLLVFLHVDCPSLLRESWVFVPDPQIVFHRLSEQESFDPGMTPNGSIVCCEIMSNDGRPMSERSDADLVAAARDGLARMGYSGFSVLQSRVIRLPRSYPVFRPGFESGLAEILTELDGIENFRSIGRQGAFNYIGTLDAMDIGYGFARWLGADRRTTWQAERKRTSHYPVLD